MKRYPVSIHWIDDEAGGFYMGFLPDFGATACSATGATLEELVANLAQVEDLLKDHYEATGRHIPEPSPYPTKTVDQVLKIKRRLEEAKDHFTRCLSGARTLGAEGAYSCIVETLFSILAEIDAEH